MWHAQRKPWTIISGAPEGGIYKSTDGGDHWTKLGGGLPHELFGRSNVAMSAANPNRIYALIEAKPGSGLYRSEDAGATWTSSTLGNLITRPFYYTTLGVDPNNADVVWIGNEGWFKSTDGGRPSAAAPCRTATITMSGSIPKILTYMIQGNDGGAIVSLDGGRTWSTEDNQPTAEIYQVAVDNQYPLSRLRRAAGQHHLIVAQPPARQRPGLPQRARAARRGPLFLIRTSPRSYTAAAKASSRGRTEHQ